MKPIITLLLVLVTMTNGFCQDSSTLSFTNFETDFFSYQPEKKKHVTNDHFSYAKFVINETKLALNNDVKNYTSVHYWNIISAFEKLKVDKSIIIFAFQKLYEKEGGCHYIINFKGTASFYKIIPALYDFYYDECKKNNL